MLMEQVDKKYLFAIIAYNINSTKNSTKFAKKIWHDILSLFHKITHGNIFINIRLQGPSDVLERAM